MNTFYGCLPPVSPTVANLTLWANEWFVRGVQVRRSWFICENAAHVRSQACTALVYLTLECWPRAWPIAASKAASMADRVHLLLMHAGGPD